MTNIVKLTLALAILTSAPVAFSADTAGCLACHSEDQLASMSADEIAAAVKDTSIPPHKSFSELSDEDLQAIAKELADDC